MTPEERIKIHKKFFDNIDAALDTVHKAKATLHRMWDISNTCCQYNTDNGRLCRMDNMIHCVYQQCPYISSKLRDD